MRRLSWQLSARARPWPAAELPLYRDLSVNNTIKRLVTAVSLMRYSRPYTGWRQGLLPSRLLMGKHLVWYITSL